MTDVYMRDLTTIESDRPSDCLGGIECTAGYSAVATHVSGRGGVPELGLSNVSD